MQFKTLMSSDEKDISARWLVGIVDREGDGLRTGWAETKSAGLMALAPVLFLLSALFFSEVPSRLKVSNTSTVIISLSNYLKLSEIFRNYL